MEKQGMSVLRILVLVGLLLSAMPMAGWAQESLPFGAEEPPTNKPPKSPEMIAAGKKIYEQRCLPCHGEKGASDGAAAVYLDPRPRDFTLGLFKIKTTIGEAPPTEEDHFRIVTRGIPGSAMPSWKSLLSEEQRWQVIYYERTFSPEFDKAASAKTVTMGAEPPSSPESIKKGDEIFHDSAKAACFICHGQEGRGDGPLGPVLRDKMGNPVLPRDLTKSWLYKGGNEVKHIFTRITTGIFFSGMPSFEDKLTEEERWNVAHYVKSIQKNLRDFKDVVMKPIRVEGEIPLDPNAPLWEEMGKTGTYYDVPMSGQVTLPPRLQTQQVDLMTVRVAYNDKEIGFHLEWDDRSQNTSHTDPPPIEKKAADAYATFPVLYPAENRPTGYRDGVAIQMAVQIPDSPALPHFILGQMGKPVNLWHWKADWNEDTSKPTPVELLIATGTKAEPVPLKTQNVKGKGVFSNGRWRVVMTRPLVSDDPRSVTPIEPGEFVPVSFHAWEGTNGEVGLQRSISSWYYVLIEKDIPVGVYGWSIGGIIFAAALEIFLVRKAKSS
jgi:mono/diheme cytochrome c family protein